MFLSNRVVHTIRQIDRSIRARGFLYTIRLAISVLWREGFSGLRSRLDALGPALRTKKIDSGTMILTMPHTLHFARRLQAILEECDIKAQISDSDRAAKTAGLVFAIAPQNFSAVPPERLVAFQVEQHIATHRWTPEYLDRLAECRGVWDFSTHNIARMQGRIPFNIVYHVPFWPHTGKISSTLTKDRQGILFYGDISSPRRQRILKELRSVFPEIQIESNLFGPGMEDIIKQTAIVVNIHAQDGALLETARISEALTHGCVVVSETAPDEGKFNKDMPGLVFVPENDISSLITAISRLIDPVKRCDIRSRSILQQPDYFRLGVLRALQGMGIISCEKFDLLAVAYPTAVSEDAVKRICLSLPENPNRIKDFISSNENHSSFHIWPGLKASPGWRGAALSYRRIFRELRESDIREVLIVEDDVILPSDFDKKIGTISDVMNRSDADIFSGLIVDLHPDARVTKVEKCDGLTFVHLDRAVMMICNIYRKKMIEYLANWDQENDNPFTNTIDRYMEQATHLKVITTFPFLVEYRQEAQSTLRDSDNNSFNNTLLKSQANLARKISEFESRISC